MSNFLGKLLNLHIIGCVQLHLLVVLILFILFNLLVFIRFNRVDVLGEVKRCLKAHLS